MSDVFTKTKRSEVMSRIRGRGNKDTELALAKLLRRHGITGWHGCPKHATKPANNRAFWHRKLSANRTRDALVTRTLRSQGWRVLRIWEHELAKKNETRLLRRLTPFING